MRLYILCEGETEESVLKNFLRHYWQQTFNEAVVYRPPGGSGALKREFRAISEEELRTDRDARVLCLIDLFEEPFGLFTPDPEEWYTQVKNHMTAQIDPTLRPRFAAFPVVMELETWLLADPRVMNLINNTLVPPPQPELMQHPKAHLQRLWSQHKRSNYRTLADGSYLFGHASARRVYDDECPHFRQIIDWILSPITPVAPVSNQISMAITQLLEELNDLDQRFKERYEPAQTDADLDELIQLEARKDEIVR